MLFGGIIAPESETSNNSYIWIGGTANASLSSSLQASSSALSPRVPPTKEMFGAVRRSVIPKSGVRTKSVKIFESRLSTGLSESGVPTNFILYHLPRMKSEKTWRSVARA